MTTAAPSAALATIQPAFTDAERVALAGFLAGYRGLTREAYALDLRQFASWCRTRSLALFAVRRADIEGFARELEAARRARATVTRRLSTIAGFYKYAVEEELLDRSPAAHVRGPRVDYESHAVAAAWTATRPTSSPPTSRAPPGNPRAPEPLPPGDAPSGQAAVPGPNQSQTAASISSANRRSALERSLRSDPLEVSRSVSSVGLLNLLANARL